MRNISPTKAALLTAKRSRDFAQTGASLLEKKQSILALELTAYLNQAHRLREQMEALFHEARESLQKAQIVLGQSDKWASSITPDDGLTLHYRSVMGIHLPIVTARDAPPTLSYALTDTDSTLDEAFLRFTKLKTLLHNLAQAEGSVHRLDQAIRKTGKRVNALKRAVIPRFDRDIRQIEEVLALREQEGFIRQKGMKKRRFTSFV